MQHQVRLILANDGVRARALEAVRCAPQGWVLTLREPTRTLDQNARMWPMLEAFSRQRQWPVNGEVVRLDSEDWKDLLTAGFKQETGRIAKGLNGGVVLLGTRTSQMGKREFGNFMEFISATAVELGVDLGVR